MYKTRLQELCHRQQWGLSKYATVKDGPDHYPSFKASVSVNGQSFHSSLPCKSSKLAQNDAAKLAFLHCTSGLTSYSIEPEIQSDAVGVTDVGGHPLGEAEHAAENAALMSLSLDGFQKEDSGLCKNLLQELAQHEGLCIPIYNTTKVGPCHMPMFFSTVEVEGHIFRGKVGKSKKQAELNAAKVAYSFLNERGCSGSAAEVASPNLVELQHNLEHECKLLPSPTIEYEEPAKESTVEEVEGVGLKETLLEVDTKDSSSAPAELQKEEEIENNEKSFSSSKQGQLMASPSLTQAKVSALPISGPKMGTRSYLLCNRVRVYSSFPDIAFPKGIIVLPISENKWVAVSLEFPKEEVK